MVTLSYFWLEQKTEISQGKNRIFFLEIEFYMNKTCISIGAWVSPQLSYSSEEKFHNGLSSHRRPLPLSDHLHLTFWVVAYGRFDCIYQEQKFTKSKHFSLSLQLSELKIAPRIQIKHTKDLFFWRSVSRSNMI